MQHNHHRGRTASQFSRPEKRIRSAEGIGNSFTKQEVKLNETPLFFPQGFEKIFLSIYFVSLPYILGLLFLFFYVSDGKFKVFLAANQNSPFFMTWAIGYEILAALIILWVAKTAIVLTKQNNTKSGIRKLK